MKIRNKRNGTNTLAYKNGAIIVKEIIPAGATVTINGLLNINQIVNKQDIKRGWFEAIEEKTPEIIEVIDIENLFVIQA